MERPTTLTPERQRSQQQSAYNKRAKDLRQLNIGDTVRVKPKRSEWPWRKAQITGCCGPRSYTLRTEEGRSLRRNRRHLRKWLESFEPALRSAESNAHDYALLEDEDNGNLDGSTNHEDEDLATDGPSVPITAGNPAATSPAPRTSRYGRTIKAPSRYNGFVTY